MDDLKVISAASLLTNTAIAGMIGPLPDAIRDAIYRAIVG
jgi:hypothetical protein